MPTVVNGIGTWYYGKRRIHRRKGVCSFCKSVGELESYDTTLYFVVIFVPLLPLSHKRVLEVCPRCRRHRVVSLKEWEKHKAEDVATLLEKLQQDPDNRETILAALALASSYQDEEMFDELAGGLATHRQDDAAIQAQLGTAYAYFARHAEAERAFRASLAAEDSPDVRQQLALTLLKQGRPDEAALYLQHIFDNRIREQAGLIYLLIEGYQAQGMHEQSLQLMDRRDAAFPELAVLKDIKKQRKTSERYLRSGKKVTSAYLSESGKAGYQEGNWTARVPRLIGPLVLAGLLCWYLGTAIAIGLARQVYLVNGTNRAYTVAINGRAHNLSPQSATPLRLPEGDSTVEFRDPTISLEPMKCRIETSFFTRPFVRHTFVLNPDQVALLVREQSVYSENPGAQPQLPKFYTGDAVYSFRGIDYEFVPFPPTLKTSKGQSITKTRIALMPDSTSEGRMTLASRVLKESEQKAYAQRLLALDPHDAVVLSWLTSQLPDAEALSFLESKLSVRPLLVEWHRDYQSLMEKNHPEVDLRPRYRQLVAETKEDPDALYLLARIDAQDPKETEQLLRRAVAGPHPSAYALHGLAYSFLIRGEFADALSWEEKAARAAPANPVVRQGYQQTLLAAGKYDELINQLRGREQVPGLRSRALSGQLTIYAVQGDQVKAQAVIDAMQALLPDREKSHMGQVLKAGFEMVVCCTRNDVAGFLKIAPQIEKLSPFGPAFLQGKLQEAAELVEPEPEKARVQRGLLYLAARKAGDEKLADSQWQLLLADLAKGDPALRLLGDILAGRRPFNADLVSRLSIEPEQKRILLAVAAQRYPEQGKQLVTLARKLDYAPDVGTLCLRQVLD
jgi:tetratricopeptide (TPR) repeat protein